MDNGFTKLTDREKLMEEKQRCENHEPENDYDEIRTKAEGELLGWMLIPEVFEKIENQRASELLVRDLRTEKTHTIKGRWEPVE